MLGVGHGVGHAGHACQQTCPACLQVDTADELLTTELLVNGVFSALDGPKLAALCSCLVEVSRGGGVGVLEVLVLLSCCWYEAGPEW